MGTGNGMGTGWLCGGCYRLCEYRHASSSSAVELGQNYILIVVYSFAPTQRGLTRVLLVTE